MASQLSRQIPFTAKPVAVYQSKVRVPRASSKVPVISWEEDGVTYQVIQQYAEFMRFDCSIQAPRRRLLGQVEYYLQDDHWHVTFVGQERVIGYPRFPSFRAALVRLKELADERQNQ